MKRVTAFVTALALLGFGSASFACDGNMYKPLYFDGGQAIHGANNVPTSPQSKGCARVRPGHQDQIVNWLGLSDVTRELWDPGDIGLRVTVQGEY